MTPSNKNCMVLNYFTFALLYNAILNLLEMAHTLRNSMLGLRFFIYSREFTIQLWSNLYLYTPNTIHT